MHGYFAICSFRDFSYTSSQTICFHLLVNKTRFSVLLAKKEEAKRVETILEQTIPEIKQLHLISPVEKTQEDYSGTLNQLDQVAYIKKLDEIIFCAKNCSAGDIIFWMKKLEGKGIDFKIAQPDTMFLIGSNSIDTAGDLYLMQVNKIEEPTKRRVKRIFDICLSVLFLLLSPIFVFVFKNKPQLIKNLSSIFIGKYSFVGYYTTEKNMRKLLPKLKYGILKPSDLSTVKQENHHEKLNLIYARDYSISKDIVILRDCWRNLDRSLNN